MACNGRVQICTGKLIAQGAEGIISGYTAIELLIKPGDTEVELFETTRLHAEKAAQPALTEATNC